MTDFVQHRYLGVAAVALTLFLALAACVQPPPAPTPTPGPSPTPTFTPSPTPSPTPTPTPDPRAILREAAQAMEALESARFTIQSEGAPVFFNPEQTLIFNSAEGVFVAPDRAAAVVAVRGPGLNLQLNTIVVGDEQWLSNPLTGQWEQLPPELSFNPAIIFDEESGWGALLEEGVTAVTPHRRVSVEGEPFDRVDVTLSGAQLRTVTAGLAGGDSLDATLWLTPDERRVARLEFTTLNAGGEPSDWLIIFTAFDEPATVEAPQ